MEHLNVPVATNGMLKNFACRELEEHKAQKLQSRGFFRLHLSGFKHPTVRHVVSLLKFPFLPQSFSAFVRTCVLRHQLCQSCCGYVNEGNSTISPPYPSDFTTSSSHALIRPVSKIFSNVSLLQNLPIAFHFPSNAQLQQQQIILFTSTRHCPS